MTSIEAVDRNRRVFSFEVALRDIGIEAPVPGPWGRFPSETPADNIAATMNALVNRGARATFATSARSSWRASRRRSAAASCGLPSTPAATLAMLAWRFSTGWPALRRAGLRRP